MREKCPYSEFSWSLFSGIRTEHGKILRISPNSVRMRENTDQINSTYGHFSRSVVFKFYTKFPFSRKYQLPIVFKDMLTLDFSNSSSKRNLSILSCSNKSSVPVLAEWTLLSCKDNSCTY